MKRSIFAWAGALALTALLIAGSMLVTSEQAAVHAQNSQDILVPKFEADPYWPKPLPHNWVLGSTIGVSVDSHGNIWVLHRPGTVAAMESLLTRQLADCCTAAPDVLEFNPAGDLIRAWGKAPGHDWPTMNHGITVDKYGNVWIGGGGKRQPGPPPGSTAQFPPNLLNPTPSTYVPPPGSASWHRDKHSHSNVYHDSFILKFSEDGKFLGEIGRANASTGDADTKDVRGATQIRFIPGTDEMLVADGYGNHRVSVWNGKTLKFIRMFGAYGHTPSDEMLPVYNPNSPQFGDAVHCAVPSNDGYIYVCDRTNDRIQIFKYDGTYVKQVVMEPKTRGGGSPWAIAFSSDPQQKFMYVADGANEKIHVFDRASMKELYWFGGGGRQPGQFYGVHSMTTDSHGNIFTGETYHGQRVQKFVYKGLVPLSTLLKAGHVGNSIIGK